MTESFFQDAIIDVVELCALLQCVGFTVKSLDTNDTNHSQDGGGAPKTIVINCHSSGIHVVLESPALSCSCPPTDPQSSGFWQISGITGGKQHDKESGSTLLHALPKPYRERLSKQLHDMIRCIRALNDIGDGSKIINKSVSTLDLTSKSASIVELANKSGSLVELSKEGNKSASMLELSTPEKRRLQVKVQTPTRYRSLDTLVTEGQPQLNTPIREDADLKKSKYSRQSTYTVSSPGSSVRTRNKTSSPIQAPSSNLLDSLIEAEKVAENLHDKLAVIIKDYLEEGKNDSSISSMLDVSKISVLKQDPKAQYASSPNLSGLCLLREDDSNSRLKRFESASTSNLTKPTDLKSKLKRLSPNIFKQKKDGVAAKNKGDGKSKLQSLFRPKIVIPVRTRNAEPSPVLNSASKKKFSHVKSTIPRPIPTPKKE